MAGTRSDPAPRRGRGVQDSQGWATWGLDRRRAARADHRCAECRHPLPKGSRTYCSPLCELRFRGRFFWDSARTYVLRRDGHRCQRCGVRRAPRTLEVDHVWEISLGGPPLDYANLQTLCRRCHREKTTSLARVPRRSRGSPGPAEVPSGVGELILPDGAPPDPPEGAD